MVFGENLIHIPITVGYCQSNDYYLFTLACCYFCRSSSGQSSGSYGHWTITLDTPYHNGITQLCQELQVSRRSLSRYYPAIYSVNEAYTVWQICDLKAFLDWLHSLNYTTQKRCGIFRVYAFFRYKTTYFGGSYQQSVSKIREELQIGQNTLLDAIQVLVDDGWLSRYGTPSAQLELAYRYRILK